MLFECPVWEKIFREEKEKEYMQKLQAFVKDARKNRHIFPEPEHTFRALQLTPYDKVSTVIIGQDPYHTPGVADGLAFSSAKKGYCPPSLKIILQEVLANMKEFNVRYGYDPVKRLKDFSLHRWAAEGVLLLNKVLTVEKGSARSHYDQGWEIFITRIIEELSMHPSKFVIMLWGKEAQQYQKHFDAEKHLVLTAPHPAAESYKPGAGFIGCRHFYHERQFRLGLQAKKLINTSPVAWLKPGETTI